MILKIVSGKFQKISRHRFLSEKYSFWSQTDERFQNVQNFFFSWPTSVINRFQFLNLTPKLIVSWLSPLPKLTFAILRGKSPCRQNWSKSLYYLLPDKICNYLYEYPMSTAAIFLKFMKPSRRLNQIKSNAKCSKLTWFLSFWVVGQKPLPTGSVFPVSRNAPIYRYNI